MDFNAYSLCPCGSGKKIKFCCSDLFSALQELFRMIEGDQCVAALKHVEGLEAKYPDRAALLASHAQLLRDMDDLEGAKAVAERFVEKYPENPIALAEMAIATASTEGGRQSMAWFQKAMAASSEHVFYQVYEAMGILAQALLSEGEMRAGRAMAQLQLFFAQDDEKEETLRMLIELNRSPAVPLLFKEERPLAACPDGVPWKNRYHEAIAFIPLRRWQEAETGLTALSEEIGDSPAIWRTLATLRGWLADNEGSIEAWRKYAALEEVPLEDAVEAEALAMLLAKDPLGDLMDIQMLTYPVHDVEQVQTALIASPRAVQMNEEPVNVGEDDVPPKATYVLVNHAEPESAEELTLETIPRFIARVLLFGKQTDREARLEVVGVTEEDREEVEALLRDLAGDALGADVQRQTLSQTSVTESRLQRPWHLPSDITITREQYRGWIEEHRDHVLLEVWPRVKLGFLDGQSLEEAASQEAYRVRALAAVMVLDYWSLQEGEHLDLNRLREQLGLPTLGPIDPDGTPIQQIPLTRLHRVDIEKLSDDDVQEGYRRSIAFGAIEAMGRFARAMTERPAFNGQEEQLLAYDFLVRLEEHPDRALEHIDRGRDAAKAAGQSSAKWDLLELNLQMERGDLKKVPQLIEHLRTEHINEPGVAKALVQFFIQIGAINPDGTPARPMPEEEADMVAAGQAGAEPGKLWTPESQQPSEKKTIWTPGD